MEAFGNLTPGQHRIRHLLREPPHVTHFIAADRR
jgi:hypothetical protein